MSLSCTTNIDIKDDDEDGMPPLPQSAKKRGGGGSMNILRAALFLARRKSKKAELAKAAVAAQSGEKSILGTLLCSVRPLHGHHQLDHDEDKRAALPAPPPALVTVMVEESFKDATSPVGSPSRSSVDGMSRYASAEDLHALDEKDDDVVEEAGNIIEDGKTGAEEPNEIDLKAEEFIQSFYEEMRLQSVASRVRRRSMSDIIGV